MLVLRLSGAFFKISLINLFIFLKIGFNFCLLLLIFARSIVDFRIQSNKRNRVYFTYNRSIQSDRNDRNGAAGATPIFF